MKNIFRLIFRQIVYIGFIVSFCAWGFFIGTFVGALWLILGPFEWYCTGNWHNFAAGATVILAHGVMPLLARIYLLVFGRDEWYSEYQPW